MNTPPDSPPETDARWERELLRRFSFEVLREQRRTRRWGIFFKLLVFAYVLGVLGLSWETSRGPSHLGKDRVTGLVDVKGVIAEGAPASADNVIEGLRAAFEDEATVGIIVRINSPGGSPVQAGYINDEIKRLRGKYPDKKLFAVIQDICASGGYYVAAAAEEIHADKASLVGSIGVRMDSFGFVEALEKLGVERRLLTAGEHKGFLDPFLPLQEEEVQHVSGLLAEIHTQFMETVKAGRGQRLKDDPRLFSGYVWTGARAVELGLVDGLASAGTLARERFEAEDIVDFTPREGVVDALARRFGTVALQQIRHWTQTPW